MLGYFKSLFQLDKMDEQEESRLESDINKYTQIIYSSKYADSNSNTEHLENLLRAIRLEDNAQKPFVECEKSNDVNSHVKPSSDQEQKDDIKGKKIYDEKKDLRFVDRLRIHLMLLDELQGEDMSILPAQPVHQTNKFGKQGGAKFNLMRFDIPARIYRALETNNEGILNLTQPLSTENYIERFQTLLWIEEAHQAIEMRRYDQQDELLARYENNYFLLQVPGLAEGRPSLMRGDKLMLRSQKRGTAYEGCIHVVREKDVLIKLHSSLHESGLDGLRFDVSFLQSRTTWRRCHQGVVQLKSYVDLMLDVCFPLPVADEQLGTQKINMNQNEGSDNKLRCFITNLNEFQQKAVVNILKSECRPSPYIIFGPPGTGKTITLVEAILQVYARDKGSRILICGNSNSCVDLIASRIKDSKVIPIDKMLRVSAYYRVADGLVPPEVEDITLEMDSISASDYSNRRIILTTCSQSGALYEFRERFDYVFMDEAGHANEPESLISIGLVNNDGGIVLAGDPMQLGPVCMSHVASRGGLGTSLLERLSRRSVYQRWVKDSKMAYDPKYITKLLISYRCDKRIMKINNELFYHNELKFTNSTPKRWLDLFKVNNPLIYHNVKGRERREYVNPSWFNPNEAIVCLSYVKRCYDAGLRPDQLGIITPYRRQIEKISLLFGSCGLRKCKIATMEEFQGDEKEIIIISTVRTRERNLAFDKQFNLGFLFHPKRFNVAISRAKWMVIVVGDKQILSRDDCWAKYLQQAHVIDEHAEEKDNQQST